MATEFFTYSGNIYNGAIAGSTDFALVSTAGKAIAYLEPSHIHVYTSSDDGETWVELSRPAQWDFISSGAAVRLASGIAEGEWVKVQRRTPSESSYVDFQASSSLTAEQLNDESLFNTYLYQEVEDQSDQSTKISNEAIELAQAALPLAGGTMTGPLILSGDPVADLEPATKEYVDEADATFLPKAGGTMTGPLVLDDNPVQDLEAATKQYVDDADAVLQEDISSRWNKTTDTVASDESWSSFDTKIPTTKAADAQFSTIVQTVTPSGTNWPIGKTWLQNDSNKTLSIWNGLAWLGISSGGTFTTQATVIYVDTESGDDSNDGHRIITPKKTIKNAVQSAQAGDIIKVAPGVYQEVLPIDITVANLSIVGESQRSCFIHPTPATETQIMFRCNSGTYIDGFTFVGLKASGTRGDHPIDNDATYGLPELQGWVAGFYPGCFIRKSPYINNCSNFADSGVDNSSFDPNNYTGTGGDLTSAPTGGGVIVDGSLPAINSPLRSFVLNEFTQLCLDGPGLLVCNNGYAQAVSFFGLFCHYHAKALSGGQINMEVGTTDFGRYGLIADGKSSAAIFTATANGAATAGDVTFSINAPSPSGSWFGDATRPAINMLVQIGSDIYPILSSSANPTGWNVTISRPNPSNRAENLGLINGHSNGATISFFLRSMISTASHTMEYAGSGCDYRALPENGGAPVETNEAVSRNNGKVWLTSTDQSGKFKVGDTFTVDQQTGFVNVDPNSYGINLVSDLTPQLGGDLDVLDRKIYTSLTNGDLHIEPDGDGRIRLDNNYFPNKDGAPSWALRTDGAGNMQFEPADLWGVAPVGSAGIGAPGTIGFGVADPPFSEYQLDSAITPIQKRIDDLENSARVADLEEKMAVLWEAYLREVALRQIGLTIGQAGLVNFGVGPAVNSGTPVPVGSEQDYYPIHAASNSFM